MPLNRVTVADPGEGALACVQTSPISFVARVQQRTSARRQRGLRPRLIFRPNWGPEGQKNVFGDRPPPPLSRGLDDRSPPPTPHLKVWIGHLYWVICENERNEVGTEWVYKLPKPRRVFGLLTSDFRLPTSVAIKGGGRPTRLLPYAKMLLVSITFFPSAG